MQPKQQLDSKLALQTRKVRCEHQLILWSLGAAEAAVGQQCPAEDATEGDRLRQPGGLALDAALPATLRGSLQAE